MLKIIKKYVSKPNFVSQKIINKKFVAIHEIKPVMKLNHENKPNYVGFSILDLLNFITDTLKVSIMLNCCLQIQSFL